MTNDSGRVREWKTVATDSKGKAVMDDVTICTSFIRQDFVLDCLRSIHKYVKSISYKIISVNQTQPNREFEEELYSLSDIVIRPHVNFGFSQSMNIAMRIAPSPYILALNDDVLMINDPFPGIFETFSRFKNAAAVCSQSVKEPGWGWGEPGFRYLIPEKYITGSLKELYDRDRSLMARVKEAKHNWEEFNKQSLRDPGERSKLLAGLQNWREQYSEAQEELETRVLELSYQKEYTDALIEEKNWAVVDGFAMFAPVFRSDVLDEIGMFDEAFTGGGEDYDWLCRSAQAGYRNLSTSRSLLHHHWGKSKDDADGYDVALPKARPSWNCLSTKGFGNRGKWRDDVSVWGEDWAVRTDLEVYQAPL